MFFQRLNSITPLNAKSSSSASFYKPTDILVTLALVMVFSSLSSHALIQTVVFAQETSEGDDSLLDSLLLDDSEARLSEGSSKIVNTLKQQPWGTRRQVEHSAKSSTIKDGADTPHGKAWIGKIGMRMQYVYYLLGDQADVQKIRRQQQGIITDISSLIDQLQKQNPSQSNSDNENRSDNSSQTQESSSQTESTAPKEQDDSGQISQGSQDSGAGMANAAMLIRQIPKDTWGHLPLRFQEVLQRSGSKTFLPQYRQLIESYYRRLAQRNTSSQ